MRKAYCETAKPDSLCETVLDATTLREVTANVSRVLVVDESFGVRRAIETLLAPEGYVARGVGTIAAARELLAGAENFSVVISDLMLPDGDLLALCEFLRSDSRRASVPVLCLTGEPGEEAKLRAQFAGASAVLLKPIVLGTLVETLHRLAPLDRPVDPLAHAVALARRRESLQSALAEGVRLQGLIFAMVTDHHGDLVAQIEGKALRTPLPLARLEKIVTLAHDLVARLRRAGMRRMTVEGPDASLLLEQLDGGETLALGVSGEVLLGMARLYVRRLAGGQPEEDAEAAAN
jgi:CheY-like chemotaxis protein/predicted regulator of Ras-like GTPase activity (Roadblock/LC7/MglB family)